MGPGCSKVSTPLRNGNRCFSRRCRCCPLPFAFQLLPLYAPRALPASLNLSSGPHVHLVTCSGLWPIPSSQTEEARAPLAGVNKPSFPPALLQSSSPAESFPASPLLFVSTAPATLASLASPPCWAAGELAFRWERRDALPSEALSAHPLWSLTFCLHQARGLRADWTWPSLPSVNPIS